MRLRKANRSNRRETRRITPANAKQFCYIEYTGPDVNTTSCGCGCGSVYYKGILMHSKQVPEQILKRHFPSYAKAIKLLTMLKLNILEDEGPWEWSSYTPCKIVEGCYTKSGKEIITRTVSLTNERNRSEQRNDGSRLTRELLIAGR